MAFNIILVTTLLFFSACKPATSSKGLCAEKPSETICQSIIDKYADLRRTTFLNKYNDDNTMKEVDLIGKEFLALSTEAHDLAPCISLSSQSYANYFNAMSTGYRAYKERTEIDNIYPKSESNKIPIKLLERCVWDLGEAHIIFADYVFSKRYEIKDGASIVRLIDRLNSNEVSDNITCLLILSGLSQSQRLVDPANKHFAERDIIEAEIRKCNFNAVATEYVGTSDEFIEEKIFMIARSNFSLLDQEITGMIEVLKLAH